jgi:hypothetical protein
LQAVDDLGIIHLMKMDDRWADGQGLAKSQIGREASVKELRGHVYRHPGNLAAGLDPGGGDMNLEAVVGQRSCTCD